MNRRDFIKTLGVGVTIAVLPSMAIAVGQLKTAVYPGGVTWMDSAYAKVYMVGGIEEREGYFWVRMSVEYDGKEWHQLIRKIIDDTARLDSKITDTIAGYANDMFAKQSIPARVSGTQVMEAFERT